jgi:hypothetical protein
MKVHWTAKWIAIPYNSRAVVIQGILSELPEGDVVQLFQLLEEDLKLDVDEGVAVESQPLPEVKQLLLTYADAFAAKVNYPPPRSCTYTIPLIPGAKPVSIHPYHYAPALKDKIERQVKEMLQIGLIQHNNSSFSSPVLLVKKKDNSYRFCVDYHHLNAITIKGQFPIPIIYELLDELGQASWFSTLDLCAGFHQIPMEESYCFKTAFQTHVGHYEFRVMSFGLTRDPNSFQKAMNSSLAPLLRKCALVFFDDILVYSTSYEEHIAHLDQVLSLLQQHEWKVKLVKCSFAQRQISYLGYVISDQGVSTCPGKVKAVAEWPIPQSVMDLRSLLGLPGYYRKFVK